MSKGSGIRTSDPTVSLLCLAFECRRRQPIPIQPQAPRRATMKACKGTFDVKIARL